MSLRIFKSNLPVGFRRKVRSIGLKHSVGLLRNIKIQIRLISSFIILSFIPLLITSLYAYYKSSDSIKTKISTYSLQIADKINTDIEHELSWITDYSENVVYSDYIQKSLDGYNKLEGNRKLSMPYEIMNYLTANISTFFSISDIRFITNSNELIYNKRIYLMLPDEMEKLEKISVANQGVPSFTPVKLESGHSGITLSRQIFSNKSFKPIGFFFLTVDEQSISDMYSNMDLGEGADIFVLDSKGTVVSSRTNKIKVNSIYEDKALINNILEHKKIKSQTLNMDLAGKRSLITFSYVKSADWYVVCTIPYLYLNSDTSKIGFTIALSGLLCFLFSVFVAILISRSISIPLKNLIQQMNKAKNGELEVQIKENSNDEIGEVTLNFNNMMKEINNLIEEIKESERQKSAEKIKALQAQINPHFISNTLNTVKWLATVQNADNINNLVTALIELLQVSMGKGEELIPIEIEIDYVKNYISIQEYRYCEKFTVQYDIEEEILQLKIPGFTIQPLVENAIIHGIEPMEGHGNIIIQAAKFDRDIMFTITDNGVGFEQEKIQSLLTEDTASSKNHFNGIGIKNVDERLKLLFGQQYGIDIDSIPNVYTKVSITIPCIFE